MRAPKQSPWAKNSYVYLLLAVALALPAVAQQTVQPAAGVPAQAPAAAEPANAIKISSGDLLEISVFGMPDLSRSVRVSSNGGIFLPFINSVTVAGLTSEEAQQLIAKKYTEGNYLRNPQVSVFVKEYATQGVSVMGEVAKPGIYPLLGATHLYDAISAAGGTTPRAGTKVTIVHRGRPDDAQTVMMSNDPERSPQTNVPILPGDTVIISKAGVVYVVGDVNKPGGYVMENAENLTAMQAVALAQGTTRTAALNNARLIRKGPAGLQEVPIPLGKIFAAKAADVKLQADDILFVPGSASKSAAKRGLDAIISTLPGMAIYTTVR